MLAYTKYDYILWNLVTTSCAVHFLLCNTTVIMQLNHRICELHSPSKIPPMAIVFSLGLQLWDLMIWLKELLDRKFLVARILCVSYSYAAEISGQPDTLKENLVSNTIVKKKCCQVCVQGRVIKNFIDVSEKMG